MWFDRLGESSPKTTLMTDMTLMMTSAEVVETLVNVTNNSPSQDYSHPGDQTTQTTETPGFKPFTTIRYSVTKF